MKKNILIGGYDTQQELKEAIEGAGSNGYQKENLVIVSKDGANLESFADNYGVNLRIVGSQELGNQRFLDSVKALFMGEDPATSSGIDPDKKDGTRFDEHDLDRYASLVFDGKYVLIADYYGKYPNSTQDNQRITAENSEGYMESASAREVVHESDIKTLADKSADTCCVNENPSRTQHSLTSTEMKTSEVNREEMLTKDRLN
ncbi:MULTISPECIES: general stress protein [Cytobacillus]|uniref:general stress protein n=1 Tax=Cytobacillus TaxID=2675230 RepID=UPI002040B117|nr:general stress protein [Cytobacillus firmus]MCM3708769.1 general stress protein [Cytobacillus firmus]